MMISQLSKQMSLTKVLEHFPLQVDPDCKPVILPARKLPVSVREKLKEEVQRLEVLKS